MYYHLNGIPFEKPSENTFWLYQDEHEIVLKENDQIPELEAAFPQLHTLFIKKLFDSRDNFERVLQNYDPSISLAGLDAEGLESQEMWMRIVKENSADRFLIKLPICGIAEILSRPCKAVV